MTNTLNIQLVDGWSVTLSEQRHVSLKWKAVGIKDGQFAHGEGVDQKMALMNCAEDGRIDVAEMLRSFGF